ncbi:MAG: DoxX family membrane protein [Gemmatimonadales bacterium]|nr:DoxX family membrane protein [Gemmatimonadales bacterium]NIN10196.1 DoxX family membrane protein [Gemmatimonadales bacterium]NIN48952.1 DoxX family membrane protein [Gemmatimonadales bacterium]NIP06416.1 DoxX family membrane protein [Gemmatimonadales bacterium]NIQ98768.1 DoxX family membrane protein [Gemmatimonadales bacterium]
MMQQSANSEVVAVRGYKNFQVATLVALRIFIGWHFFYEGLAKLLNQYWTSAGYLADSQWWFKGLFLSIATSPSTLAVVDFLNVWGLILIGLGLMLGLFSRAATIAGIVLLALYWIVAPPFVGYTYAMPAEGSYLVVNKVLIELTALCVLLAFPTSRVFGLDRLVLDRLMFWKRNPEPTPQRQAHA